jgi:hypothetical protein
MNKHAPGPWQLWDADKHVILGANLLRVATAAGGKEFAAGNARLIAAAPELLQFVKFVEARLASVLIPNGQPEISRAFADIKDAARTVIATLERK